MKHDKETFSKADYLMGSMEILWVFDTTNIILLTKNFAL